MIEFLGVPAYLWGRAMTGYTLLAARPSKTIIEGIEHMAHRPGIYIGWHSANLIEMNAIQHLPPRERCSFVPPGLVGAAMRGMLDGVDGIDIVQLPEEGAGGYRAAMRSMADALEQGKDVIIACDGPSGPPRKAKPGAAWLARMTGRPLIPIGCSLSYSVRLPRWDRLLVPLPGARAVGVFDPPMYVERRRQVDDALLKQIEDRLNFVTDRAWEIVAQSRAGSQGSVQKRMEKQ